MRFNLPLMMGFLTVTWTIALPNAWADTGFYFSAELGANVASALQTAGTSDDRASVCDEFINPMFATVTQTAGYENYNCTGADRGLGAGWTNAFGRAEGLLAGAAVGYRLSSRYPDSIWGKFNIEIEYFYRDTVYDDTADVPGASGATGDKLAQEIVKATDRIGNVTAHNVFLNLLLEFDNSSRYTPYIGIGAGAGFTDMEYASLWVRNPDSRAIATGAGLPNVDEIRRNLAGSTSSAQTRLSDTVYGYQVVLGFDYAVSESVTLGIKGRWVRFDEFSDGGFHWDPLRSHVPNLRRDLSEPVVGYFRTEEMEVLGMGVTLKYRF